MWGIQIWHHFYFSPNITLPKHFYFSEQELEDDKEVLMMKIRELEEELGNEKECACVSSAGCLWVHEWAIIILTSQTINHFAIFN